MISIRDVKNQACPKCDCRPVVTNKTWWFVYHSEHDTVEVTCPNCGHVIICAPADREDVIDPDQFTLEGLIEDTRYRIDAGLPLAPERLTAMILRLEQIGVWWRDLAFALDPEKKTQSTDELIALAKALRDGGAA